MQSPSATSATSATSAITARTTNAILRLSKDCTQEATHQPNPPPSFIFPRERRPETESKHPQLHLTGNLLPMINYSEQKYAASTIEVNYVEGPDNGPPMVLIHGLGSRWTAWDPVIDQFAEKWHVYAIDLRGHGDSGRVPDGYGFVDYLYCP